MKQTTPETRSGCLGELSVHALGTFWDIVDSHGDRVALVPKDGTGHEPEYARLLASAPELLAALQELLDCPDLNLDSLEPATMATIQHTRSAIDKATGRS